MCTNTFYIICSILCCTILEERMLIRYQVSFIFSFIYAVAWIWVTQIRMRGYSICNILWHSWLWKGFGMKDGDMCINLFFPIARRLKETTLKPMPAHAVWVGLKTDFICHCALESCSVLSMPVLFLKIKCILGNVYRAEDTIYKKIEAWNT